MKQESAVKRLRLRIVKSMERARARRRRAEDKKARPRSWRDGP